MSSLAPAPRLSHHHCHRSSQELHPSSASSSWEQLRAGKLAGSKARSRNEVLPLTYQPGLLPKTHRVLLQDDNPAIKAGKPELHVGARKKKKEQGRNVLERCRTELDHPDT